MIFVTAQPDEIMFAWQTEVQLKNLTDLGVDLNKVNILVGYQKDGINSAKERWNRVTRNYPTARVHFIEDERESKRYIPSIRPFLLKKFLQKNEHLEMEYKFYFDSDVVFSELPAFEAMEDNRWHVSKADYISWNYIEEKKSPSLMRDMLSAVGIDEETVKAKQQEVGGVQYYIYGDTAEFWSKVEQDCERMWITHHNNFNTYRREFFENKVKKDQPIDPSELRTWLDGETNLEKWDFQIWCTDMWCIYWNALICGMDVYVNPELDFVWPTDNINRLEDKKIYHDTGIEPYMANQWFCKRNYRVKSPFVDDLRKLGYQDNGTPGAQRYYLNIIESISQDIKVKQDFESTEVKPLVSCLMTTYGRFECVERSIASWLLQDYTNKELVILNTAEKPLILGEELKNKGIRVYNGTTIHGTNKPYTNVGQVRADIIKLAFGDYYICWDDDDLFLPWHISQGMDYILSNGKRAYMPKFSYYTGDGGNTFELAKNSMEASCIVHIDEIKKYGFHNSDGDEHLTWRTGLVQEGKLDENVSVTPFESYLYIWGEEIAPHKQSGSIGHPNVFEDHKKYSTDFGVRPLSLYSPIRLKNWFLRILRFTGENEELKKKLMTYLDKI